MAFQRLGIIGGSGLGALLGTLGGEERIVETPFGPPSGPIQLTEVEGVPAALLSRHGPGHIHSPSRVPYRANIWALKSLGVTHILASTAVGSLRAEIRPKELVIPDQLIDKTFRRETTFFDDVVVHAEMADPLCLTLRGILNELGKKPTGAVANSQVARAEGHAIEPKGAPAAGATGGGKQVGDSLGDVPVHPKGTYVCMEGPQFSTRAESLLHRQWGADLIGMTAMPEAKLAREAEICYALVALPTDYDCWNEEHSGTQVAKEALLATIIGNLQEATRNALALIKKAAPRVAQAQAPCSCQSALKLAVWTKPEAIPAAARRRLALLLPSLGS